MLLSQAAVRLGLSADVPREAARTTEDTPWDWIL